MVEHDGSLTLSKAASPQRATPQPAASTRYRPSNLTVAELSLLMRLDMLRYKDRSKDKVSALLSTEERKTLQSLVNKKFIYLFKKEGDKEALYSISKDIYDKFLFGKRGQDAAAILSGNAQPAQRPKQTQTVQPRPVIQEKFKPVERFNQPTRVGSPSDIYVHALESSGYVVIASEPEAAMLSVQLEESLKNGTVVGTRAFNRKYYVAFKSFVNQNAGKLLELIQKKGVSAPELSRLSNMNIEAVRAILYILSEQGDVSETRKDVFKAV